MNQLLGIIKQVSFHDGIALIDVDTEGTLCSAMLIGSNCLQSQYVIGTQILLCFKEFEVALARDLQGMLSLSNRLYCRITDLQIGQIMTRVKLKYNSHELTSVITTRSVRKLALEIGDYVEALIKANEMNLQSFK